MKTNKKMSMTLLLCLALLVGGCGGSDSHEPEPVPQPEKPQGKRLGQTCNIESPASETTVTLMGLTAKVSRYTGTSEWLNVDVLPYSSGAPQVKVVAMENSLLTSRQQELTFYAASDTLILTVRQATYDANGGTDMDEPFDTPSDKPGFARRQ